MKHEPMEVTTARIILKETWGSGATLTGLHAEWLEKRQEYKGETLLDVALRLAGIEFDWRSMDDANERNRRIAKLCK